MVEYAQKEVCVCYLDDMPFMSTKLIFYVQAVQRDKVSSDFLRITGQIEEALSKISYDELHLSEEVQEQVSFAVSTCLF